LVPVVNVYCGLVAIYNPPVVYAAYFQENVVDDGKPRGLTPGRPETSDQLKPLDETVKYGVSFGIIPVPPQTFTR
jgi:hypothetical protein